MCTTVFTLDWVGREHMAEKSARMMELNECTWAEDVLRDVKQSLAPTREGHQEGVSVDLQSCVHKVLHDPGLLYRQVMHVLQAHKSLHAIGLLSVRQARILMWPSNGINMPSTPKPFERAKQNHSVQHL